MSDIRQITNFDTPDDIEEKTILKNGSFEEVTLNYKVFNITTSKLGYCINDNQGIDFPIFITVVLDEALLPEINQIYIGKTGMYEFQPEYWIDVNDEEPEERLMKAVITSIAVPDGVPFCIDYVVGNLV